MRRKVFVSYSHKDDKYLKELKTHLKPLIRNGDIDLWDDTRIPAGQEWHKEIQAKLAEAFIAILLVSPHFLASDYIDQHELPLLLQAAKKGGLVVIPVVVSSCRFNNTNFAKFQPLNSPDKPLNSLKPGDRDSTWVRLITILEDTLLETRQTFITNGAEKIDQLENTSDDQLNDIDEGGDVSIKTLIKSVDIEIDLDKDFDSYSEEELAELVRHISEMLRYGDVKIKGVRRSSVKITLEIPVELAQEIISATLSSKFEGYGVVAARISSTKENDFRLNPSQFDNKGLSIENIEDIFKIPTPQLDDQLGDTIENYKLLSKIGEGGLGTVYLAEHHSLGRKVAIKIFHRYLPSQEAFYFKKLAFATLSHPHIATVFDIGITPNDSTYLVSEYVNGVYIHQYCDSNRLSIKHRLELFLQVCDAVSNAHTHFVIHGDLKPFNILVTEEGIVKLLDFGIAHAFASTEKEIRFLTPRYASPEQFSGDILSTATDVYSLGLILYELLTGQHPYSFENGSSHELERMALTFIPALPSQVVMKHIKNDELNNPTFLSMLRATKPNKLKKELRGDLDAIVLKALIKDPASRYSNVGDLRSDIRKYLESRPISARNYSFLNRTKKHVQRIWKKLLG